MANKYYTFWIIYTGIMNNSICVYTCYFKNFVSECFVMTMIWKFEDDLVVYSDQQPKVGQRNSITHPFYSFTIANKFKFFLNNSLIAIYKRNVFHILYNTYSKQKPKIRQKSFKYTKTAWENLILFQFHFGSYLTQ